MDTHSPESRPLLTLRDLHRWKSEIASDVQVRDEAQRRINAAQQKLDAALIFVPEDLRHTFDEGATEADVSQSSISTGHEDHIQPERIKPIERRKVPFDRREWLNDTLLKATQGASDEEIMDWSLVSGGGPETLQTIRTLIESMTRRGRLRKRGAFFYHPAVLRRIEAGEIEDREGGVGKTAGDIRSVIRKALSVTGDVPAKSVIAQLWLMPEALPIMERNPQYPYAMLSRMAQSGELERIGNLYHLPRNDVEVEADRSSGARSSLTTEER